MATSYLIGESGRILKRLQIAAAGRAGGSSGLPGSSADALDLAVNQMAALIVQADLGLAGDAGITATLQAADAG